MLMICFIKIRWSQAAKRAASTAPLLVLVPAWTTPGPGQTPSRLMAGYQDGWGWASLDKYDCWYWISIMNMVGEWWLFKKHIYHMMIVDRRPQAKRIDFFSQWRWILGWSWGVPMTGQATASDMAASRRLGHRLAQSTRTSPGGAPERRAPSGPRCLRRPISSAWAPPVSAPSNNQQIHRETKHPSS